MNHYLLVFDRAHGKILDQQEFSDRAAALKARFRLEREQMRHDDIEIVVLGAESPEALRRTHTRYFQTAAEMLRTMADSFPDR